MEKKLALLAQAGVIDKDTYHVMLKVISRLEEHWELPLRNEQGERAMIHLVMAMMRVQRGEEIQGIDASLLDELVAMPDYPLITEIHQDIMVHFPLAVPAQEEGYLLMNLASLHQRAQEA